MGLKILLIISIIIFLPACTAAKVEKTSTKLIPYRIKESVKVAQIQSISKPIMPLKREYTIEEAYQLLLLTPSIHIKEKEPLTISHIQEGKASYYSSALHGRKTASGSIYNENKLTAAHKYLPFGTKVRVLNKKNGRSVFVRINDRGPFVKKRILDLSYFAAKKLDMIRTGVTNIKMEVLQ